MNAENTMATDLLVESRSLARGVAQIHISGTLDWTNFHRVGAELQRWFADGVHRIIVNLEQVKMISSAGFGCFIGGLDVALRGKGNLVFVRVPRDIQDIFCILGLNKILTFAESEADAMAKFVS